MLLLCMLELKIYTGVGPYEHNHTDELDSKPCHDLHLSGSITKMQLRDCSVLLEDIHAFPCPETPCSLQRQDAEQQFQLGSIAANQR